MTYAPNMQIYKYTLSRKVGGGSFGEVWTAVDQTLDNSIAVKLLDASSCSIDERLLEAKIGNSLTHPNVINIKNADVVQIGTVNTVIIAMPYYVNGSVVRQVNAANFLDLDKALKCIIDVLRGLEYLHENGYYHCDIKPQNILIGDNKEYILTDYGITCYSPNHTSVKPRNSYLPHAASEVIINNQYDVRTDIYQLGLTAFRLINGISLIRESFDKDAQAFRQAILDGKLISDSSFQPFVPHKLRRIIAKATSVKPDERYQSALEMRRELEKINLHGGVPTADEHGNIMVNKGQYSHQYKLIQGTKGATIFTACKVSVASGRTTKMHDFTCPIKTPKEARKAAQKLFLSLLD